EVDKKSFVDCLLRNRLINLIASKCPTGEIIDLLSFAFSLARKDLCSKALLASLLGDILDTSTVEQCELIFGFVEDHLNDWKKKEFDLCRNPVLRLSNDLLRRLSRTTHTVFCGRIFVFLARLLPLNEKSGLNSIGLFNTENVTKFDTVEDTSFHSVDGRSSGQKMTEDSTTMEVEEGEMDDESKPESSVLVDYNLYCKFWQLQSFFSSPLTCYDKFNWKKFVHNATEVLNAFASHKLTESQASSSTIKRLDLQSMELDEKSNLPTDSKRRPYFAKYLTSQKLLQLQLCDNNFRRYVLTQFLILFQFLTIDARFKDKKVHVLNDEQTKFVKESTTKCYTLLTQTYPEGAKFAKAIELIFKVRILQREEIRNSWKNAGCEDFLSKIENEKIIGMKRRAKEKYSANPLNMGNNVLTKLFSTCPNNFEACKATEREFIPDLEAFIEEPLEQIDLACQIEDEYKIVSNENFQWRAMRLTLLKSPHFFNQPNANVAIFNRPPDALEKLFADIAKDVPKYNKYVDIYKEKIAQKAEAAKKAKEAEQMAVKSQTTEGAKTSDVQDTIGESALESEFINLRAQNLDDLPISQSAQSE
uniref:THO complex subunit 1 n=1 Tax=Romanomermis culicivorax TaxID=13658 RepID=A0A915L0S9_ROMCU